MNIKIMIINIFLILSLNGCAILKNSNIQNLDVENLDNNSSLEIDNSSSENIIYNEKECIRVDDILSYLKIDSDVFRLKPLKEPSFKNNKEILESYESLLESYKECKSKLKTLKKKLQPL